MSAGYTGSKNQVQNSLKIQFVELDFSNLFFQRSSMYRSTGVELSNKRAVKAYYFWEFFSYMFLNLPVGKIKLQFYIFHLYKWKKCPNSTFIYISSFIRELRVPTYYGSFKWIIMLEKCGRQNINVFHIKWIIGNHGNLHCIGYGISPNLLKVHNLDKH